MEKFELHYYLKEDVHSMDAFVKNKAEAEVLKIFKEVSSILDLDLDFEVEALGEGGIKEFFKILNKKKNRKKIRKALGYLGVILTTVITTKLSDMTTSDSELDDLTKDKLKLEIKKLQQELDEEDNKNNQSVIIQNITVLLLNSDKVKFHRSKFYSQLIEEQKIEKLSVTELNGKYEPLHEEKFVERPSFNDFVIETVEIDPEYIEDAVIEIISPVLVQRKMKWKGMHNDTPINFYMMDGSFKNQVLSGEISFTNGTSIRGTIKHEKAMDDNGEIKIISSDVDDVMDVFQGSGRTETKRSKQKKESENQTQIDFPE